MCGAGSRFDMGLHIINQLPYLWSRANPLFRPSLGHPLFYTCRVCTHSSFLRPARHTELLNLETLYYTRASLHVQADTSERDTCIPRPGVCVAGSNLLRFISASKLMAEAVAPAVPSKTHPLFVPRRASLLLPVSSPTSLPGKTSRVHAGPRGPVMHELLLICAARRCKDRLRRFKTVRKARVNTLRNRFRIHRPLVQRALVIFTSYAAPGYLR